MLAAAGKLAALAFVQPRLVMIRSLDLIHVASAVAANAGAVVATGRRVRELAALARLGLLPRR